MNHAFIILRRRKEKMKTLALAIIAVLCLSALSVYSASLNATGLPPAGYWKFDEGTGVVASDSSGKGNAGTLMNEPQWVNGVSGKALSFDGSDDYVLVQDSSSLDIRDQISVEFWMKPAANLPYPHPSSNHPGMDIFNKGDAYVGSIHLDPADPNYGEIEFALPGPPHKIIYSKTNLWASGEWYHLAFTYDGSNMRVYVNGVLDNTVAASGNIVTSGFPLAIGSYCLGTFDFFEGVLDELTIYDYARCSEQILEDASLLSIPAVWSKPRQMTSDPTADDFYSSIMQDSSGKIWLARFNGHEGTSVRLLCNGQELASDMRSGGGTSLLQDSTGRIWLAWGCATAETTLTGAVYYRTTDNGGQSWSSTRRLTDLPADGNIPSIIQVSTEIWIVFKSHALSGNGDVWYVKTNDGGASWSEPIRLTSSPAEEFTPDAMIDSTGKIWVVWTRDAGSGSPRPQDIYYKTSIDNGASWSLDVQLTSEQYQETHTHIVEDVHGKILVFYQYFDGANSTIWYKTTSDRGDTWSDPQELATDNISNPGVPNPALINNDVWVSWASEIYEIWLSELLTQPIDITWGLGSVRYDISISCNDTVTLFELNKTDKRLSFTVAAGDDGVCSITIPRCRLDSQFNVTINGSAITYDIKQNDTDSTLSFSYISGSNHVDIEATERGYMIGDINGDGQVNILDISMAARNFGKKETDYP
jgi:hypothetical protein